MEKMLKQICDELDIPFYQDIIIIKDVTDISEAIANDDPNYYLKKKDSIDQAIGLFYTQRDGKKVIIIKKMDEVNYIGTLVHEYVHFVDYTMLSNRRKNNDIRKLEDDYVFLFWTEYHATYLSYKYLLNLEKASINPEECAIQIIEKLRDYYNSNIILDRKSAVDTAIRSYASYSALYNTYPTVIDLYPKGYFLDKRYLQVYNFLNDNKEFIQVIDNFDELEWLINSL